VLVVGLTTTLSGNAPTLIVAVTVFVGILTTDTALLLKFGTYNVFVVGFMPHVPVPTPIGAFPKPDIPETALVERLIA